MSDSSAVEFIYKYRPIDAKGHTERIITHNELYFSRPIDFNDPFDCRPKFSFSGTYNEIKEFFMEFIKTRQPQWNRKRRLTEAKKIMKEEKYRNPEYNDEVSGKIQKRLNNMPICCFSDKRDNILMWSHYADKHRGICLQFVGTSTSPFFGEAHKVVYQIEYPIIEAFKGTEDQKVRSALLTKAKFWEYEAEWRIFFPTKKRGIFKFPGEDLKGIILGAVITPEKKEKILEWASARKNPIKIYEARIKQDEYGIEINEI